MSQNTQDFHAGSSKRQSGTGNDPALHKASSSGEAPIKRSTSLLIIGAGPYGLTLAAYARHLGIDHLLVGTPMALWHYNMPRGMFLRSRCDWHLDPLEQFTLELFLRSERGMSPQQAEPIPLSLYLDYADWFQKRSQVEAVPDRVVELSMIERSTAAAYVARLESGGWIEASNVAITTGFGACPHIPSDLTAILPQRWYRHSCDFVDPSTAAGRSIAIIGGRQSAFEAAALAAEHGARSVHLIYRHNTPAFTPANWSWISPLLERIESEPGWYGRLPEAEKQAIADRMFAIGRLQLEAWLWPRINVPNVLLWSNTRVTASRETSTNTLRLTLSNGLDIEVEEIVLATGYSPNISRLDFLLRGNFFDLIQRKDGYPLLDPYFQSSLPGLFFTNAFASRTFGKFFDFTAAVRTSARIIGRAVQGRLRAAQSSPGALGTIFVTP